MVEREELRVLLLGPLGPPHVEDQALGLSERGFDVHVAGDAPAEFTGGELADAGLPVWLSPEGPRATPWGMAATIRWTRRLIATLKPDVVHAHWLPGFSFAAAVAGASPLVVTAWGSDVYRASAMQRLAGRYALRRARLVTADSQDLLDACAALGGDPARMKLIQWGADLETFRPSPPDERAALKRSLGLGSGPVVLSPRSLAPVYNIPVVIEAFNGIGDAVPDSQLVLKHMGSAEVGLPAFPHPDRVHVMGRVPYERMAEYYRAADVCVSVTSSDSSPRSVWEAMAAGCPCVLSDLPWVTELIEPGEDALTIPVDADALAQAVLGILGDAELRDRLASRGRALVEQHLNREREMDRLAELLTNLARR